MSEGDYKPFVVILPEIIARKAGASEEQIKAARTKPQKALPHWPIACEWQVYGMLPTKPGRFQ